MALDSFGIQDGGGGGNRTRVRKVSNLSVYACVRRFRFRPGSRPPARLFSRLVRLNFAHTPYGPKSAKASPLNGISTPSRERGEARRSLAFKQREPAQCRLVCFATLLTGPSGVPDAQLSLHTLSSKPDRPHKMRIPSGGAIRAAGGAS